MKIVPLEDKVVVRPIEEKETVTASGFIIQRGEGEKPSEGIVEAVGPGVIFQNGTRLTMDIKVGDKVVYNKYAGTEVKDVIILPYRDILVVID